LAINRQEYRIIQHDINSNKKIGLQLPFKNGKSFLSLTNTTEQQLYYNMINLLLTTVGERYHQPRFGTELKYILFENYTEEVEERIKNTIDKAVSYWLPGIKIVDINVDSKKMSISNSLVVNISFVVDVNQNNYKTITLFADEVGKINVSGNL